MKKFKLLFTLSIFLLSSILLTGCNKKPTAESTSGKTEQKNTAQTSELTTAKQAYTLAKKEAQNWAGDAVLVDLSNFRGSDDMSGKARKWKLEFNSVEKDKELEVYILSGEFDDSMEQKFKDQETIDEGWIDSSDAMEKAKEYFEGEEADNYWMGLTDNKGTIVWNLKCDRIEGKPLWVKLNAQTGEVIETREGY